MTSRPAGTLAALLVTAGVVLAVLLVTWAASIGPGEVLRGDGPAPETSTSSEPTTQPSAADDEPPPPTTAPTDGSAGWWLDVVVLILNVATVLVGLALLVWLVRWLRNLLRTRRALRARRTTLDETDIEVLAPGEMVARELLAEADAQRTALSGGSPRNGVVECWHRFEVAAAAAGIPRRTWETSSEHTLRVLDLVDADSGAVARLAELYREARFSEHELTEGDRATAVDALAEVHRSVRRSAAGAPR